MATAEFSKFDDILSAALSQHPLSGFGIAQLDSITSTSFVHSDAYNSLRQFAKMAALNMSALMMAAYKDGCL